MLILISQKLWFFNKSGKILKGHNFLYDGNTVILVNEYRCLGIIFKPSGSLTEAINQLAKKFSKAFFLYSKITVFRKYECCITYEIIWFLC